MRRPAALLVLAAALGLACAERPRTNPFDPGNPSTRGRPSGFAAIGDDGLVSLRWQSASTGAPVAYQLYRRAPGQSAYAPLGPILSATQLRYDDTSAVNGQRYEYRLFYVLSGSLSGLPAEDWAIPGTTRVWFSDIANGTLHRLSADGHRIAWTSGGFFGPTHVAFDGRNRRVWLSDTYSGLVASEDRDGASRIRLFGLTEPVALEVDSLRDRLWVCDQARDAVFQYRLDGVNRVPFQLAVDRPTGVAHDLQDGSVWVCERGASQLRRFFGSGTPYGAVPLPGPPWRVAVDSLTQDAWVTSLDAAAIYRVTVAGAVADTIALSGPIGVAVDHRAGRVWVADAVGGAVVALRRSGAVEFRVTGLPRVREVAVDLRTGECWATVPGAGAVTRISPAGVPNGGLGGLGEPIGIAIEP